MEREDSGWKIEKRVDLLMKRRIVAWILLAGFILLLLNILVIGYQREISIIVYLIIAFYFIITMSSYANK